MTNKKIKLGKCPICSKYPRLMKAMNQYKYFCGVHCSVGGLETYEKQFKKRLEQKNNRTI